MKTFAVLLGLLAASSAYQVSSESYEDEACWTFGLEEQVDQLFRELNQVTRSMGATYGGFPSIALRNPETGQEIYVQPGLEVGADSLQQCGVSTGKVCFSKSDGWTATATVPFGLSYWNIILPYMKVGEKVMSGSVRVWENEFIFSYSYALSGENVMRPVVERLELVRASNIELWSSCKEYDGKNITEFVNEALVPLWNQGLSNVKTNFNALLWSYNFRLTSSGRKKRSMEDIVTAAAGSFMEVGKAVAIEVFKTGFSHFGSWMGSK